MNRMTMNPQSLTSSHPLRSSGFTLIEAMIAVTIIALSVSGPLVGASRGIVLAQISRDQLTSSYLAQEGIEYLRAMRDDAYLNAYRAGGTNTSSVAWTDFTSGASTWSVTQCISSACTLDPGRPMGYGATSALNAYAGNAPLYLNNGIYTQQQVGTRTSFTRTIQASMVSATELIATSTVSWSFHNAPYSITVVDHMTSWQ